MMRKGFTLVELVIVVLILGILAAIAIPRVFNKSREARNSAVAQSLVSIRKALDMYRATHNRLPSGNTTTCDLPTAVMDFLRSSTFPRGAKGSNNVKNVTGPPAVQPGAFGWVYSIDEGEIIINSGERVSADTSTVYSDL